MVRKPPDILFVEGESNGGLDHSQQNLLSLSEATRQAAKEAMNAAARVTSTRATAMRAARSLPSPAMRLARRAVSRRTVSIRSKADELSDVLADAIDEAKEACSEDPKKADCAVAWDNVSRRSSPCRGPPPPRLSPFFLFFSRREADAWPLPPSVARFSLLFLFYVNDNVPKFRLRRSPPRSATRRPRRRPTLSRNSATTTQRLTSAGSTRTERTPPERTGYFFALLDSLSPGGTGN